MDRQPKPAAARPRRASASRVRTPADAAADIDRVIETYITEVILEEDPHDPDGMYWYWPRAAWVDPNQLIVDADDGTLRRVEFSTNDQQKATFADPIEVLETFVDISPSAKAQVLAAAHQDSKPRSAMRVFESRDDVPGLPKREPEAGVGDPANNVGMNRDQLLKALGLPADATDEQVDARTAEMAEQADPPADPPAADPPAEDPPETDPPAEDPPAEDPPADPPAAASGPREGMVEVPKEAWAEVQAGAKAGAKVAAAAETKKRDDTIAAACGKGKISPSAKASMENLHKRDPDAFYNLLTASVDKGGLADNLVPVTRQGGAGGGQDPADAAAVSDEEMARMFPEVNLAGGRA